MSNRLVRRGYSRRGPYAGQQAGAGYGCGVDSFVGGPAVEGAGGPGSPCPVAPPYCGCNVLGGNTLGPAGDQAGIGELATRTVTIDSGDACRWQPRSMLIAAYSTLDAAGTGATQDGTINCERPATALLLSASVGSIQMIRRVGSAAQVDFGIIIDGYSDNKELTCVDWSAFTSTNNQQLSLLFLNPCDDAGVAGTGVHVFVDLWGDNLAA